MLSVGVLKTCRPTERHGTSGPVFCFTRGLVVQFHTTRGLVFCFATQVNYKAIPCKGPPEIAN